MMKCFHYILVLLFVFTNISCKRNSTILISGRVDSLNTALVRVTNSDFTITYDSTVVINNSFKIAIKLPETGFYNLVFLSKTPYKAYYWSHSCLFYADKKASYSFDASGPSEILHNQYNLSSNSSTQNELNKFNRIVTLNRNSIWHKKILYMKLSDRALSKGQDSIYRKYLDTINLIQGNLKNSYLSSVHQYVKENTNTLITPYLINKVPDLFEQYNLYSKVLRDLSPAVKESNYYKPALDLLQSVKSLHKGAIAPVIYGKDIAGNNFNLIYATKKIILVDFWASYCAPCRNQMPELKALYEKYKDKGFCIISISIDEDRKKWIKASKQEGIPWYNISEGVNQSESKNIKNFVIKSIPANYILNEKGKLIGRNIELDSLKGMLRQN